MPTYRVKFRDDRGDQLINADSMGEHQGSFQFYRKSDNSTVAQVPKDVVLVVIEEGAEAP